MKKFTKTLAAVCAISILTSVALAQVTGYDAVKVKKAKDMLAKADQQWKKDGKTATMSALNGPTAYVDGDIYVYCVDATTNKVSTHPVMKALVNTDFTAFKDSDGKAFGKTIMDMAKTNPNGVTEYKWLNKTSGKIEQKAAFYQKIGDQVCVANVYK